MTAEEYKKAIIAGGGPENDMAKSEADRKKASQNVNILASVLARLDAAMQAANLGGIKVRSGYRTTEKQRALWNQNTGNGKHKPNPATATPGTSAHESGAAADTVPTKCSFDDYVKFAAKWFMANNIDFDQLIDESGNVNNHNGWLHIGMRRLTGGNRHQIYIMWGGTCYAFNDANTYIASRNKHTGGSGSGKNAVSDGQGSGGTSTISNSNNTTTSSTTSSSSQNQPKEQPMPFNPGSYSDKVTKEMTPEEIKQAQQQYDDEMSAAYAAAMAAAGIEYEIIKRNSDNYDTITEEEIMEAEADLDAMAESAILIESDSPFVEEEIQIDNKNNTTQSPNIIDQSNPAANSSQVSVQNSNNVTKSEHTRIYEQAFDTKIQLDEMSLNFSGTASIIDPSTGQHIDNSNVSAPPPENTGSAYTSNITKQVGNVAPLIRINDAYYSSNNVAKLVMDTTGFIPTIILTLVVENQDILKDNAIKEGDICSIFIQQNNPMLKSYRGDYKITSYLTNKQNTNDNKLSKRLTIFGELYIPALYDGNNTFSFAGTSADAMKDVAKRLGLSYFFCDNENTNDAQVWQCVGVNNKKNAETSPIIEYIKKISLHAYKDPNSFYASWIDPRYGLSFLNVNKLLGADGLDENVDMAFFNNAMTTAVATMGNNVDPKDSEKANQMTYKLLSNVSSDSTAMSEFYVTSYEEYINTKVTDQMGLYQKQIYTVKNTGLSSDNSTIDFTASLCVNKTKLEHGFTILAGPGKNTTYQQANNGDYTEQHTTVVGGTLSSTQSDADQQKVADEKSNMKASGNEHKFFKAAEMHNKLNLMQLEKKKIKVVLNGKNFQVMRGEKIPMLLTVGRGSSADPIQNSNTEKDDVLSKMNELDSGWFIIDGITWTYDNSKNVGGTFWSTTLWLTRREWPIPGWVETKKEDTNTIVITNQISNSDVAEAKKDEATAEQSHEITTNGLLPQVSDLWKIMNTSATEQNLTIKLVGAKRWAADANGKPVDGEPKIQDKKNYKFVNSCGDVVWFSDKTSPHLYGRAIDIINGPNTEYNKLLAIFIDPPVMAHMLENGMFAAQESCQDDTGNKVKHFHISVVDDSSKKQQKAWWAYVKDKALKTKSFTYKDKTYDLTQYSTYYQAPAPAPANTNNTSSNANTGGGTAGIEKLYTGAIKAYSFAFSPNNFNMASKWADEVNGFPFGKKHRTVPKPEECSNDVRLMVVGASFHSGANITNGGMNINGQIVGNQTDKHHGFIMYKDNTYKFCGSNAAFVSEYKKDNVKWAFQNYLIIENTTKVNYWVIHADKEPASGWQYQCLIENAEGQLEFISCTKKYKYREFADFLVSIKAKNAIYLDTNNSMGYGWARTKLSQTTGCNDSIKDGIFKWGGVPDNTYTHNLFYVTGYGSNAGVGSSTGAGGNGQSTVEGVGGDFYVTNKAVLAEMSEADIENAKSAYEQEQKQAYADAIAAARAEMGY